MEFCIGAYYTLYSPLSRHGSGAMSIPCPHILLSSSSCSLSSPSSDVALLLPLILAVPVAVAVVLLAVHVLVAAR